MSQLVVLDMPTVKASDGANLGAQA